VQRAWYVYTRRDGPKIRGVGVLEIGKGRDVEVAGGGRWMVWSPLIVQMLSGARKLRSHFPSIMNERIQIASAAASAAAAGGAVVDSVEIARDAAQRDHRQSTSAAAAAACFRR